MRLFSAPFARRLADVFGAFRLELALFAIAAAVASLLYLPAHYFWLLALVNLTQVAMLAPLVPLSDALALSWSRSTTRGNSGAFEYGWVRGIGSAAFVVGVLVAGQSAAVWGLPSVLWLTAAGLFAAALSTRLVPDLARDKIQQPGKRDLSSEIGSCSFESPHSCAWYLRPPLLLGAMPCMTRSQSYAGVTPEFPLPFRACCGRNRLEQKCWYLFSLVHGC